MSTETSGAEIVIEEIAVDDAFLVRLGPPAHGDVIHTNECRYARRHPNPLRWQWADRIGFENIDWDAMRRNGIRPCRVCHPEQLPASAVPSSGGRG